MINKLYLLQKYLEKEGLSSESIKTSELIDLYNLNKNAEFLTAKRDRLQSITWNGKTYNALGYLPDGSPVALISKEDIESKDVSSSGPFELLGQTNISVTNADETQNYNLAQYQGGNVLPVSVRPGATGVTQNKTKVDYGDASSADIAIEIGGILGAFPLLGEPVDIASGVIAAYKDPPDYILAAISILCAVPVLGIGAAVLKPVLRRLGSAKKIGEKIGEEMAKNMEPELIAPAVKEAKELAHEVLDKVAEKIPEDASIPEVASNPIQKVKKEVDKIIDGIYYSSDSVKKTQHYSKEVMLDFFKKDISKLTSLGITPVEVGGKTMAGAGKYGRAYHVIYKGQPAVAKVIGKGDDISNWKKIIELSSEMPSEFRKHLPEIKGFPAEDVMIMEALEDLPSSVKSTLSVGRPADALGTTKNYISELIRSSVDKWFKVDSWFEADDLIKAVKKYPTDIFAKESWTLSEKSVKDLKQILSLPQESSQKLTAAVEKALDRMNRGKGGVHATETLSQEGLNEILEEVVDVYRRRIERFLTREGEKAGWFLPPLPGTPKREYWSVKNVRNRIGSISREIADNARLKFNRNFQLESFKELPVHGDTEANLIKTDELPPEFQSFYKMLNWLKERGITWRDIHEENIMMNPKTREIVLLDVGEFVTK
jgi:hypothetical protein